ncbi:heme ABC transporter ATP-binding protein [Leucobacter chromiireducens]|uniref:Heme ABC transporter ATP-binding protein n=1 Tax=Leucobacter chromiireducens subsp. solipictus TaxID=398235 RepID=A0ABS1SGW4_9MICO|nr:heme ABC transporter ATP-binding protein [Leucobacter chromiireducens]MBL3679770.1 heme ABC transporter ATP-binding protein [Leucobacter chromiireducens subsp. solipictus]
MSAMSFRWPRTPAVPPEPAAPGTPLLRARGVAVTLGGKPIVEAIDLDVHAGEIVAIIGPNGAGKSTLLGALAGDYGYTGSIEILGTELTATAPRDLALRRAVLRQSNAISFPFSVVDVVKMGRAPWRRISTVEEDDRVIAQELLRSDTYRFAERAFPSLSGGERARVALARAMAQRTPLLFLDEPTAALDINYQEQVLAVARRTARQGNGVVVVLHDLAAAAVYADRILLLEDGRARVCGTPREVMQPELLSAVYRHPVRVLTDTDGSPLVVPTRFADDPPATDPAPGSPTPQEVPR